MSRNFNELLAGKWKEGKMLCVGLDSDLEKLPDLVRGGGTREALVAFNRAIVDATKDLVCAFKLNSAFYEARGDEGWNALRESIQYINDYATDVPVILDSKRGDVTNTNEAYVTAEFDHMHADAVTINPYPGREALQPFLDQKDKGIFIWCKASNGGSSEFQDLEIGGKPLYMHIAEHVTNDWNGNGNCALVIGATYPEELARVRAISQLPILIPAIGSQGGDIAKTVKAGGDAGGRGMVISASRSIIFASSGTDFADAAREKATELHSAITKSL